MFSPSDPLRDLFESVILEPLAFMASVPKLLASGRAKIESQKKTANMIGKFVVPMAKRKIDAELKTVAESVRSYLTNTESKSSRSSKGSENAAPGSPSSKAAPSTDPSAPNVASAKPSVGSQSAAGPKLTAIVRVKAAPKITAATKTTGVSTSLAINAAKTSTKAKPAVSQAVGIQAAASKATSVKTSTARTARPIVASAPTVNDLGLDSYDDLPASSVVGLLEALTPAQLRAIALYEASHRNRQTILGGVSRILDAAR